MQAACMNGTCTAKEVADQALQSLNLYFLNRHKTTKLPVFGLENGEF